MSSNLSVVPLVERNSITLPPSTSATVTDERLALIAAVQTAREIFPESRRTSLYETLNKDPLLAIRDGLCVLCSKPLPLPLLIKYETLWRHFCAFAECPECWEDEAYARRV